MKGFKGGCNVPARPAMVGFAGNLRFMTSGFGHSALIDECLFEGEMVAFSDAENKIRGIPLPGREQGEKANEQRCKGTRWFFQHRKILTQTLSSWKEKKPIFGCPPDDIHQLNRVRLPAPV
jgi:hypothetical protein